MPRLEGTGVVFVLPSDVQPADPSLPGVVRDGHWRATVMPVPPDGITLRMRLSAEDVARLSDARIVAIVHGAPGGIGWQRLPPWLPQDAVVWSAESWFILPWPTPASRRRPAVGVECHAGSRHRPFVFSGLRSGERFGPSELRAQERGAMATRFDFNCDMGESFGAWTMGLDAEVIRFVTSANIACGFHAGDPATMRRTVRLAEAHGVGIGAHPGFPDLQGFGRRNLAATPDEVRDDLVYQIGALTAFTRAKKLQHVKPHGALYNMAVPGGDLARAIGEAVLEADPSLILVVLAGSTWADQAERMGLRVAREAFADRALMPDGTLVPRSKPGAVIHDTSQVIERSLRLATEKTVVAIIGRGGARRRRHVVPARRHARRRGARRRR